jgi:hypothetical protein
MLGKRKRIMTDFLNDKCREITDRLMELKPLVDEYSRLEAAASALDSVGGSPSSSTVTVTPRRRGPGRPRGSVSRKSATVAAPRAARKPGRPARRRAGRRKGSGTRAGEALSFIQGQPGITIPELAAKMDIKQNHLHRVLPGLAQEDKARREGRGWHPKP